MTARATVLTVEALAADKGLPADFLRELGLEDSRAGVLIDYRDLAGDTIAKKRRTALKAKEGSFWPTGKPLAAYGEQRLHTGQRTGVLHLVEGESDCWTGWFHSLPVIGIPGANGTKVLNSEHLVGISHLYVHRREPDRGGDQFVAGTLEQLRRLHYDGRVYELRMPDGVKDLNDLHRRCAADGGFGDEFQECIQRAQLIWPPAPPPMNGSANGKHHGTVESPAEAQAVPRYTATFIDAVALAARAKPPQWLVSMVLVAMQLCILGGPRKAMKTTLLVALAVALAMGLPFLGCFAVPLRRRVALISGESGEFVILETLRRICQAHSIAIEDTAPYLRFDFRLPRLSYEDEMAELQREIVAHGTEVLIIDPTYLCLLVGAGEDGAQASNVLQMGPLYQRVGDTCLSVGCTPILANHFNRKRQGQEQYAQPDLGDLSMAGAAEVAAQWLLLGRREAYHPGDPHRLWMVAGGRVGHSSTHGIDIDEGRLLEDFTGRQWDVRVLTEADAIAGKDERKVTDQQSKRVQAQRAADTALLEKLDAIDPSRDGVTARRLREALGWSGARISEVIERLITEEVIERYPGKIDIGSTAKTDAKLIRRTAFDG